MTNLERTTNGIQKLLHQGVLAERDGNRAEARRCFEAVRETDPDNIIALLWLAWLAPTKSQSMAYFCRVLELDPHNEKARSGIRWARQRPETAAAHMVISRTEAPRPAQKPAPVAPPPTAPPAASKSNRRAMVVSTAALTVQRLLFGTAVLLTIIFLSYFGSDMAQGAAFGSALNRAAVKTVGYLSRIGRGDLGLSSAGSITMLPIPVVEIAPQLLARSLGLLGASLFIATVIGIILGMAAAGRRNSGRSLIILMASIAGISVPSFFAAVILQRIIILWARNIGTPPLPVGGFGWDKHIILPALVLAARPIAQIARVTFISIGEILEQDYIRTAHSKGLRPYRVMTRHVVRNAAIPILTTIGLSLRFSLSSLPVVEFFFGWPGLGYTLLKAISRQDDNLTIALLLCLGIIFILINLILEFSYRLIDPRLQKVQTQLVRRTSEDPLETLKMIFLDFWEMLVYHPLLNLKNWFFKPTAERRAALFAFGGAAGARSQVFENTATAFRAAPKIHAVADSGGRRDYRAERQRAWLRGTLGNLPFMLGAILVTVLIAVVLFGPYISPHSPYTTHGLVFENGEFIKPPFAPDAVYPLGTDVLGRDILTLILSGAQQTLLLATLVVAARLVLGFILGAVAGWLNGSWLDRLLLGATEAIAAFPTLLLAMMLILALGIRSGLRPFVIALCFVGWGETMQFVRGEVLSIRPKLFIESAVAVGLRTPRIILSHVLPNLLPSLISIAALEMGAVLMLLGELGFIGIFIGGGAFAELGWLAPPYHYSDVPEWGALLSNVRTYAQTYSWMAVYPSLAYFVAILGFNLFGEGIRRMVESVGLSITRLVNRYTVAAALLIIMGFSWAQGGTGITAVYRQNANTFDGSRALAHVQALTAPEMEGGALGTAGLANAGDYIAQQFEDLGIQAAGERFSYFQTRDRSYETLDGVPKFRIEDEEISLRYGQDYAEYAGYYRDMGAITGRVRFLALDELTLRTGWGFPFPALERLDYADEVLLVLADYDAHHLYNIPRGGILVVAEDAADLMRRYTLSSRDRIFDIYGQKTGEDTPTLLISDEVANRLLAGTGYTVADLRYKRDELVQDEIITLATERVVSMEIQGTVHEKTPARHVLGHLPGRAGSIDGAPIANTAKLDDHLIVVMAQYDAPPPKPDGAVYPAANDNASAVAVMLETIRVMQEAEYQPFRSFLFVAYSGEGLEGGLDMAYPDASEFLKAKYGFSTGYEIEAVVRLRGLGAGAGDDLVISAGGSTRLADLFEESARLMGVKTQRGGEMVDISIVFEDKDMREGGQEAPNVGLRWEGWEATSRLPTDTLDTIAEEKLESSGRALTLALMILGREAEY